MAEGFAHARVSGKTIACQARQATGSKNVCDADILTHLTEIFPEFFNSQHSQFTSKYRRLEKMSINMWIKPLKKARRTGEVTSSSVDWLEWYWHSVVHFKCELKHSLLPKMLKVIEDLKGLLLDPPFRLFVKTLTGKTMLIDETFSASTVYEIKDILWELYGAPPDQQRLIFAGKQLRDDQTMSDCGIRPESTLFLVLRLRGCDCGCDVRETWDESEYAESADAPENVALEDTLQDEESENTQQNDEPEDILQNNERGDLEKYDESEDTAQVDERKEIPHNSESETTSQSDEPEDISQSDDSVCSLPSPPPKSRRNASNEEDDAPGGLYGGLDQCDGSRTQKTKEQEQEERVKRMARLVRMCSSARSRFSRPH